MQESEVETLTVLLLDGRPVRTGAAIYTLNIGLNGEYEADVKADKHITRAVNVEGAVRGDLIDGFFVVRSSRVFVCTNITRRV